MDKFTAFYNKVMSDEELAAKVAKIFDGKDDKINDEQLQQLSVLAKEVGLDISVEEAKEYFNREDDDELKEEELDMVAGGKGGGSSESEKIAVEVAEKALEVLGKCARGCFVGDSKISTPDGFKLAKDIKLGDEVYTFDIEDNKIVGKVLEIHAVADAKIVDVEFSNGATWKTTSYQWFYCGKDDYACVMDTKGKSALTEDGQNVKIVKATDSGENADIYDFTISGENIFIVNGVAAEGYTGD
jgi:hypothetical protein